MAFSLTPDPIYLMYYQQSLIVANFLMVMDAIIIIVTGYVAYAFSLQVESGGLVMGWHSFLGSVLFVMFANNYSMGRFGLYSTRRFSSTWSMIKALFAAVSLGFIVLSAGAILVGIRPFSRVYLVAHFLLTATALIITRGVLYHYLDHTATTRYNSRKILLVGNKERIMAMDNALDKQPSWGHQVAGWLTTDSDSNPRAGSMPVLGRLDDFDNVLKKHQIDEVIFALPRGFPIDFGKYLTKCKTTGVTVRIVPALFDLPNSRLRVETIQGIPTLTDYAGFASAPSLLYKRILDIMVGGIGFLLFLLLYPVVGLAIKLDSPGPILFKHRRVGMHGRAFDLYKFRSMVRDAESKKSDLTARSEMSGPMFKMQNDPRITKVGRFLRKTSIDEFPQFMNVLKGEMSVVGTRPPTPDEVKQYEDWHRRRICVKPGITGLWQISGRNTITDFTEVVGLDLQYIDGWRFWKDLSILWKTIWVVLGRKGAK